MMACDGVGHVMPLGVHLMSTLNLSKAIGPMSHYSSSQRPKFNAFTVGNLNGSRLNRNRIGSDERGKKIMRMYLALMSSEGYGNEVADELIDTMTAKVFES